MPSTALRRKPPIAGWAWLLGLFLASAQAQPADYLIDPSHTRVYWEVVHFGTSTSRGRFDDVDGSIRFDRSAGLADVSIVIGTASVDSGVAPLDSILRGSHFLASPAHPHAYFVANRLRMDAPRGTELRGEFTLRGISQPLALRSLRFNCYTHPTLGREVCGGDFEAEMPRSDFGITYGLPFVANTVRLVIQIEAIRSNP